VVLLIEAIFGAVWVVQTFSGFLAAGDEPLGARVSVLLAVLISWAWVLTTLLGAWRRLGWARGSALTLHVLMFAAATGILQGLLGPLLPIGILVLALSLIGFLAAILARPDPVDTES